MSIGYGIIGSGTMGLVYAEALATQVDGADLVAVAGGSRAPALAADYGVPADGSAEALLARDDVDVVILATPHTTHLPYTRAAADAGKHVYCEKPMAVTVEECDEMIAACAQAGVLLTVAKQSRQNPVVQAAKELIDAGEIGDIRMIRMLSSTVGWDLPDGSWAEDPAEGGAYLDWGVHGMDVLRWLTGAHATRVFATFANYGGHRVDDVSAMAQYELDTGVMVQVWMSYEFPAPGLGTNLQLMIVGERGLLDLDRYRLRLGSGDEWRLVTEMEGWDWTTDPKNPRRIATSARQVEDFTRSVVDGSQPAITGADGRAAVELVDAARRSARTHQVVEIAST